jgi:hypothetical protein
LKFGRGLTRNEHEAARTLRQKVGGVYGEPCPQRISLKDEGGGMKDEAENSFTFRLHPFSAAMLLCKISN